MELANTRGQSTVPSNRLMQMMRHHPLVFYFLLAIGISWVYELLVFGVLYHAGWSLWGILVWTLGPTLAAALKGADRSGAHRAGLGSRT